MYKIMKQFHFSASHQLSNLPHGHACSRLHGHNYIVQLVLGMDALNRFGFVRDYGELDEFARWLKDTVDHRHLNDVFPDLEGNTSAENLARVIYERWHTVFPELVEVRVSETDKTWASFTP